MKLLVVSTPIFRMCPPSGTLGYSGLEMLAWQQAKGLAAKGHDVTLVGPDGSECPGCTILPIGPERQVSEEMAYAKFWKELPGFDCIIDHTWNKHSYLLKMEGRLDKPVLGVCHAPCNTMYQSLPDVEKPCFVCISQDQANHFEALFSRVARVARNCIDTDFYRPLDVPRSKRFLFLARFSTIKGPDLAIEACRKAGVGLDLVGDTSITNEPEFLQKCKDMAAEEVEPPMEPRGRLPHRRLINLVGPATRGETVWWFSQAHCMLHPNKRFREPLGLAPLEAMACGCPVIAYDYGAMRETVGKGISGWLVKSESELLSVVKQVAEMVISPDQRNLCREWVCDEFPLQKMIDRYETLCQEAVETGGW